MNSWCIPKEDTKVTVHVHTKLMAERFFKVGIQFSTKTAFTQKRGKMREGSGR